MKTNQLLGKSLGVVNSGCRLLGLVSGMILPAFAVDPVVTKVYGDQRQDNSKLVEIFYDLADPDSATVSVKLEVSADGGVTWTVPVASAKQSVGPAVAPGKGKFILWNAGADWNGQWSDKVRFRVTARDTPSDPEEFVLIQAGSFEMGQTGIAEPVHSVQVSGFFMGRTEVTWLDWRTVRDWSVTHGYTDLSGRGAGKADTHPVQAINWYEMVKWCNAKSEMESLTPCYTVSGLVYRTGQTVPDCNWSASGYRLPSEAEWEKAARGGLSGKLLPWGDTITHSQANYYSASNYSYDVSSTRGYHPTYNDGVLPYTSPVGSFAPNGYGLYDMAGNIWEWCWDWYGSYPSTPQTDPRGATSGAGRVGRGGDFSWYASYCRVADRTRLDPTYSVSYAIGFRLARGAAPTGLLSASPASIALQVEQGKVGTSTMEVWNEGGGEVGFTLVASDPSWISALPSSGIAASTHQSISLSFNATSLSVGQHQGSISVRKSADNSEQVVIPVTLTVVPSSGTGEFVLIPAGSFQMGNALSASGDGMADELPFHTVYVSAFYMAKCLVTKADWDAVRTWGLTHGYADLSVGAGKAANHPVTNINWYDTLKWCNARTEYENATKGTNYTPCYTLSGAVYRTIDNSEVVCNWSANGYRLPTEAEWEKAARGGLSGKRFPWGDTINHSNANYYANSSAYSYDTSGYTTYTIHPTYHNGAMPYTSPVSPAGSFAPNGYGLYDMSGNVEGRCWDWYSSSYYATSPETDPRGATSGSGRVIRGGSWNGYATDCRVAYRYGSLSLTYSNYDVGFRLARGAAPTGLLCASPASIALQVEQGKVATSAMDVWNEGGGQVGFNLVASDPSWISASPSSGTATSTHQSISLSFDATSLSVGRHQGSISVRKTSDNSEQVVIQVTITVVAAPPPSQGLVAYYPFEGNASDASLRGHDGTVNGGVTFTPGVLGQGASFNGSNGVIRVASAADLNFGTGDFSVSLWVNFNDLAPYENGLICKDTFAGDGSNMTGWHINTGTTAGSLRIITRHMVGGVGQGGSITEFGSGNLSTGTWYHLVAARRSGLMTTYINGIAGMPTQEAPAVDVTSDGDLTLGALTPSSRQWFAGSLDEVRIYNRALSAAEILQLCGKEVLFWDDFKDATLGNRWELADWTLGRSQLKDAPSIDQTTGTIVFRHHTYNPDHPGSKFLSQEIATDQPFSRGTGVEFSARIRMTSQPDGLVSGMFPYLDAGGLKDEIDIEVLSKMNPTLGGDRFDANSWNDFNGTFPPAASQREHNTVTVVGLDVEQWHVWTIRWLPNRVEWLVDGRLVNPKPADPAQMVVPDQPMKLRFNLWAPESSWSEAYDPSLVPVSSEVLDSVAKMEIDWVCVSRL
ncbi:MAG: SUMF1/EgtB/PvdO family nonheme iron enzyme [Verrucomicrobia bacterium]|nr:SUMF1/EgtB/PvdO family nonheme iron enzyme [Verrucomicrobiota bacterium]